MTCQALEAHHKGVQGVGQLHTVMNQVGQSQTDPLRQNSSDSDNDMLTADSSCKDKF